MIVVGFAGFGTTTSDLSQNKTAMIDQDVGLDMVNVVTLTVVDEFIYSTVYDKVVFVGAESFGSAAEKPVIVKFARKTSFCSDKHTLFQSKIFCSTKSGYIKCCNAV